MFWKNCLWKIKGNDKSNRLNIYSIDDLCKRHPKSNKKNRCNTHKIRWGNADRSTNTNWELINKEALRRATFTHYQLKKLFFSKTLVVSLNIIQTANRDYAANSPRKGSVTRKMFPFDDVIMGSVLKVQIFSCRVQTVHGDKPDSTTISIVHFKVFWIACYKGVFNTQLTEIQHSTPYWFPPGLGLL